MDRGRAANRIRRGLLAWSVCLLACGVAQGSNDEATARIGLPIIGGSRDTGDPSVVELFYFTSFAPSACNGNQSCLGDCYTGAAAPCTSGADCTCGGAAVCSGSLIGPHTVVTAGHCTDLSAGGELSRTGGPALTVCESSADVTALTGHQATSTGCNLAVFALFDNTCSTNTVQDTCETGLVRAGSYILGTALLNPGYVESQPPYTASTNDKDIGLVRLAGTTLVSGGAEPGVLTFNREDLGAPCTDLGALRFVGYGVTDPSAGTSALSGIKYTVTHDVRVKDAWHDEEDGPQASPGATCGAGAGEEPSCSGDSGGPSFNAEGVIMGVTSLSDPSCSDYGQDTRIDAYQSWIDSTMTAWGDPLNGGGPRSTPDAGSRASDGSVAAEGGPAAGQIDAAVASHDDAATDRTDSSAPAPDDASAEADGATVHAILPQPTAISDAHGGGGGCSIAVSAKVDAGAAALPLALAAALTLRRRRSQAP